MADVLAEVAEADGEDEVSPEQWEARRDEWLGELDGLFEQIEVWVRPSTEAGHAQWKKLGPVPIREDFIGSYDAPSYELDVGRRRVLFRPVATLVVGARGRVDVVSGTRSVMLVLSKRTSCGWTWRDEYGPNTREFGAVNRFAETLGLRHWLAHGQAWTLKTAVPRTAAEVRRRAIELFALLPDFPR